MGKVGVLDVSVWIEDVLEGRERKGGVGAERGGKIEGSSIPRK